MRNLAMLVVALVATVAAAFAAADDAHQADFYVAPTGSDANPGTLESPFATLARARDAVRAKIQRGLDHDVRVLLRGGRYELPATLTFGPRDSGTADHSVIYAAFPGERPAISGGRAITGLPEWGETITDASPSRAVTLSG